MKKKPFNIILNIGVDKDLKSSDIKKVRLLNGIALGGGVLLLLIGIILYLLQLPYNSPFDIKLIDDLFISNRYNPQIFESTKLIFPLVNFFLSFLLFSILYLNYRKKINASILTIFFIAVISTYYFYFTQITYAFFLTSIPALIPIIFYDKRSKYLSLFFLNYLFFIAATFIISKFIGFADNIENPEYYILINFTVFYFFIYILLCRFKTENTENEKKLKRNNIELHKSLQVVNNHQEEIEKINKKLNDTNATKNKFFNIIAHDLRSPFNAILGFSDILLKEHAQIDNQEREELIKLVVSSSKGAYNLVENLLEWSKVQTGNFSCIPENYEISLILYETLSDIKNVAKNKGISIITKTSNNFLIFADKEMLKTILRNIIYNAVKYTRESGTITINATNEGNETIISIEDTGIGISKEKIDVLFDITQKTTTPGTNNEKGTGLGLIICKEFIEKHGGQIWIESELGNGTIFSISLPKKM